MTDDENLNDSKDAQKEDAFRSESVPVYQRADILRRNILKALAGVGIGAGSFSAIPREVKASSPSDKRERVPPEADGDNSILIENDVYQIELGETESGFWIWPIEIDNRRTTTMYHELFALQAGDGDVVLSYNPTEVVESFPDSGQPGEKYSCLIRYVVGGTELLVKRTVKMDETEPTFTLKYDIRNTGSATIDGLNFYEHADFDNGRNDFFDDVGYYQESPEYIYTTDDNEYGGFSGNQPSENHHVGAYPAYDELRNANLNNRNKFPETGSGDPVCILQWDLGALEPGETTSITLQYGGAFSREQLEGNVAEPEEIETEPPSTGVEIVNFVRPPTAIEIDSTGTFEIKIDPGPANSISVDASARVTRRQQRVDTVQLSTSQQELDGDIVVQGKIPPATSFDELSEGIGFEINIDILADGNSVIQIEDLRTYSFRSVDKVGLVAAHPRDIDPQPENDDLYDDLREKAEFLNEFYASGLGSMGGQGFDIRILNRQYSNKTDADGWIEVSKNKNEYGGLQATGFVQDALQRAEDEFDISIAPSFDTGFVVSHTQIGDRPFYAGVIVPEDIIDSFTLSFGPVAFALPLGDLITDNLPISPYNIDSGEIDAVYNPISVGAWRHEFGHGSGSGNVVGLPDLYFLSTPVPLTLGSIQGWGLMGTGDTFSAFCRNLGGEIWDPTKSWLSANSTLHFIQDQTVDPQPLTEKELDEDMQYLISAFAEFTVNVGFTTINITPVDFKIVPYVIEARKGGLSNISDVIEGGSLDNSPSNNPGAALYRFGVVEIGNRDVFENVLAGDQPFQLDNSEIVDLDYLTQDGEVGSQEFPDEPTLSKQINGYESWYDPKTATDFTLTEGFNTPEIKADRRVKDLIIPDVPYVTTVIAAIGDFFSDIADSLSLSHEGESLPSLDVIAETSDGRRVGVDPETGEIVNDIDEARVIGTADSQGVVIPGDIEFDITVSDRRLKRELESRGIDPPNSFEYDRTLIVDSDTTIEDRNGVPYLAGRTKQKVRAKTGELGSAFVVKDIDYSPPELNANSEGEFITGYIELPEGNEADDLRLSSVAVEQVQAVTNTEYGFVRNPPTEVRNGNTYVMVKFPRDEVIDSLGVGEHTPVTTAVFDQTSIRGSAKLDIFEPRNNGGGKEKGNKN